jgi:hypothetical protein
MSESNAVTGKIELSREDLRDMDWRVEQKLSRLLAERELYSDGFWQGICFAVFIGAIVWMFAPEIKEFLKAK